MTTFPGCGAARSGAPLIRGLQKLKSRSSLSLERSRVCSTPLRAALRPGSVEGAAPGMTSPRPHHRIDQRRLAGFDLRDGAAQR
ncbi:MAG: hypothetical protein WB624_01925, partial [Xanthobacteraceae bacterium]